MHAARKSANVALRLSVRLRALEQKETTNPGRIIVAPFIVRESEGCPHCCGNRARDGRRDGLSLPICVPGQQRFGFLITGSRLRNRRRGSDPHAASRCTISGARDRQFGSRVGVTSRGERRLGGNRLARCRPSCHCKAICAAIGPAPARSLCCVDRTAISDIRAGFTTGPADPVRSATDRQR